MRIKQHLLIAVVFIVLAFAATFPLALRFNGFIPGFFSTDETYSNLWLSWLINHSSRHDHLPIITKTVFIGFPFGVDLHASGYSVAIWEALVYLLSIITNPVFTYNIQAVFNIILLAFFTYLTVFYITRNLPAALFSGLAMGFSPYQFVRVWQHIGLSFNQWIVLALFCLILLKNEKYKYAGLSFSISLLLLLSFDYTIGYLGFITILLFLLYGCLHDFRSRKTAAGNRFLGQDIRYLRKVIFYSVLAFILLIPQFIPTFRSLNRSNLAPAAAFNFYHRPFEDLFAQSAKPLSYLLPASSHPLAGKFTENFVGTFLYGDSFTEHTLYLGWTAIILALSCLLIWKRRKNRLSKEDNFYITSFAFVGIAAWLFSQPPWWRIGPFKIYMPSFFMYKILPMFRAYCRFGIVVMLAVAVLAGFGLKFLLERFKAKGSRALVSALFCGLILFEFWNYPPFKVIDVSRSPAVYYWLKQEPAETVIAEYPLDADSPNELYKFFQTVHEKKMINGTIPFTYANKVAKIITKLSSAQTAGILSWMKVKYVLVHHDGYAQTGLTEDREELARIADNEKLIFIRRFPQQDCPSGHIPCIAKSGIIDVYEVSAGAIDPEVPADD